MVSKKILAVAIAAAFSSQAFAVVNLDDANNSNSIKYAKEALVTTGSIDGNDGAKYYLVANDAQVTIGAAALTTPGVQDASFKLGTGMAVGQKRYVRIGLTNAVFSGTSAAVLGSAGGTNKATAVVVQGGANKDTYVIFEVTAVLAVAQADVFQFSPVNLGIHSASGVTYNASVYETLTSAVNQTAGTALNNKTISNAISVANGLKVTATAGNTVASVDDAFKKFVTTVDYANIGSVVVGVETGPLNTASAAVGLADMISTASSKAKIKGDFSAGEWDLLNGNAASKAACLAGTDLAFNTAKTEVTPTVSVAALNAASTLCVGIGSDKVVNIADYTADINYEAVANAAFPAAATTVTFGSIKHNGTTVQVPYMTTFADYNQRVVLVNRGGSDAAYTFTFTPDSATGAVATAGTAATGTLKAGKTTVLKASDVVTLTGATRTAATVSIVAVNTNIDAATTSVNLADKSTDTVNLTVK